jgi:hypothetical protein
MLKYLLALLALLVSAPAHAQEAVVISSCGSPPQLYNVGAVLPPTMDPTGHLCSTGGGGGAVNSVANVDGTLTISPTTGSVIASLNQAHSNNWTVAQTFSSGLTFSGLTTGTQVSCLGLNASNQVVLAAAACGSGTGAVTSVSNADGSLTITPTTGAVVASLNTAHANTWTGVQTFNNGMLSLAGATSGNTLLEATAIAGAGTVATFPANTGTVAELNLAQTFSAIQTFSASNGIVYSGAATGTQVACLGLDASNNVVKNAAACGSGGGGTPGGATTNVQFNNAGAFGGDAGFSYTSLGQVTIASGSITTNNKALTITQTWNLAGTTFDAPLLMNVTNTASNPASRLIDLQAGVSGTTAVFTLTALGVIGPGFSVTSNNIGTITTGTVTPVLTNGNYQFYTNNGAHTLAPPAADGAVDIMITNGASAGAIVFSGFSNTAGVGDIPTTTNGSRFLVSIRRINSIAMYSVTAYQ